MKGFRTQIVVSTMLVVAAVMAAVVGGTQMVLESSEGTRRAPSSWDVLLAAGIVGLCGLVLSGVVAWRVSQRALAPVRQMAERADDWSAQDLAHRFGLGPPTNELSQLGQTLDHLLDRVSDVIRDEQRLTAELAHEIRTPLTAIQGSAELALLRLPTDPQLHTDLVEIAAGTQRLAEVVTSLLALSQPPGDQAQTATPDHVIAHISDLVRPPVRLEVTGSAPFIRGSLASVCRALAPLVENAARHAETTVRLDVRAREFIEFAVTDDGLGVPSELKSSIFEPGASGQGSSGLGLGIARRVARSLGGDVVLADNAFILRLPYALGAQKGQDVSCIAGPSQEIARLESGSSST